jgi:hypothetical protein
MLHCKIDKDDNGTGRICQYDAHIFYNASKWLQGNASASLSDFPHTDVNELVSAAHHRCPVRPVIDRR